ncbi:MAG: hypothetical protein AAFQ14_09785 [Cyanobacteria bacterium J06621_12]
MNQDRQSMFDAVDKAIDATPDKGACEAWYKAFEAILLHWFGSRKSASVRASLKAVRSAMEERFENE